LGHALAFRLSLCSPTVTLLNWVVVSTFWEDGREETLMRVIERIAEHYKAQEVLFGNILS